MKTKKQMCAILVAILLFACCAMPVMADGDSGAVGASGEPIVVQQPEPEQGGTSEGTVDAPSDPGTPPSGVPQDSEPEGEGSVDGQPEELPAGEQPEGATGDDLSEDGPEGELPEGGSEDELTDETSEDGSSEAASEDEQSESDSEDEESDPEDIEEDDPFEDLGIRITHDATDETNYGDIITLTGHLDGFEDIESYTLTWLHDDGDDDNWVVAQQGGLTHSFELTEESVEWSWKLTAKILDA